MSCLIVCPNCKCKDIDLDLHSDGWCEHTLAECEVCGFQWELKTLGGTDEEASK